MSLEHLALSKVKKREDRRGEEERKEKRQTTYRWRYVKETQKPNKKISDG